MLHAASENIFELSSSDLQVSSEGKFLKSLRRLEADFKVIEKEVGAEQCDAVPRCMEAKLSVELYREEHDNAGAFKLQRYEREMAEAFEETLDPTILPEKLAQRQYIFVNMGELDRLNKEGHSGAGDAGLIGLIEMIDTVCLNELGAKTASKKNVFRWGGNEYCIELDGVTDEEVKLVMAGLVNADIEIGENGDAKKSIEAPPLSVCSIKLSETYRIMRDLVSAAAETRSDQPLDLAIETTEALRRAADYNLEVAKFARRIDRAVEKIQAVRAGDLTRDEAQAFFNDYLRKSLQGTELETLESIEEEFEKPGFREIVELMAVNSARAIFADDRKFQAYERELVDMRLLAISKELEGRGIDRPHTRLVDDQKIAIVPRFTEGLRAMDRAQKAMAQETDDEWKRSKQLAYKVEVAKRDRGTGLLQRGRFYGDWTEQVRAAEAGGQDAAIVFIDMGFLKYFNDAGGRPVGDAALRKAAELMELAIAEANVGGEAYRYGGDEFAIRVKGGRKEAEAVVKALAKLRDDAGRIPDREGLRAQRRSDDPEIAGDSRADYAPTELVFNSGIAELKDFNEILNDLRRSGELDKILSKRGIVESEFKAELLVKLADASLSREKAVSRFRTLLDLMREPAYRDGGSPHRLRTESIIRYSQKSIFGAQGGDALLRSLFARYEDLAPEEIDAEIEAFVSDRVEKVAKIVASEKELADQLIELHTVRNRLLNEVERLVDELGGEHKRVLELQVRLKEAEQARADLVAVRGQIKTSAIDKIAKAV